MVLTEVWAVLGRCGQASSLESAVCMGSRLAIGTFDGMDRPPRCGAGSGFEGSSDLPVLPRDWYRFGLRKHLERALPECLTYEYPLGTKRTSYCSQVIADSILTHIAAVGDEQYSPRLASPPL